MLRKPCASVVWQAQCNRARNGHSYPTAERVFRPFPRRVPLAATPACVGAATRFMAAASNQCFSAEVPLPGCITFPPCHRRSGDWNTRYYQFFAPLQASCLDTCQVTEGVTIGGSSILFGFCETLTRLRSGAMAKVTTGRPCGRPRAGQAPSALHCIDGRGGLGCPGDHLDCPYVTVVVKTVPMHASIPGN